MGNGLSLSIFSTYADDAGANHELDHETQKNRHIMNFEDVQFIINGNFTSDGGRSHSSQGKFLLISTLNSNKQSCIIKNTVLACDEEAQINDIISGRDDGGENITVVVYGKNTTDETVITKCNQLKTLGFSNVYAYVVGMFEWLLLQDIYGTELFPTTGTCFDMLEYRPLAILRNGNGNDNRKMIR